MTDIESQKGYLPPESEQALRDSELRYRRLFEAARDGILILDAIFAKPVTAEHPIDDQLSLYVAGHGLRATEVLRVKEHVGACSKCRSALDEMSGLIRHMKDASSTG